MADGLQMEIMQEVESLQALIRQCCPEVYGQLGMADCELDLPDLKDAQRLHRQRLRILFEAVDPKEMTDHVG